MYLLSASTHWVRSSFAQISLKLKKVKKVELGYIIVRSKA